MFHKIMHESEIEYQEVLMYFVYGTCDDISFSHQKHTYTTVRTLNNCMSTCYIGMHKSMLYNNKKLAA